MRTEITVKRTDGTVETVVRPGHVTSEADRSKFAAATKAAGRGEIIGWKLLAAPKPRAICHYYTRDQGCPRHGEYFG